MQLQRKVYADKKTRYLGDFNARLKKLGTSFLSSLFKADYVICSIWTLPSKQKRHFRTNKINAKKQITGTYHKNLYCTSQGIMTLNSFFSFFLALIFFMAVDSTFLQTKIGCSVPSDECLSSENVGLTFTNSSSFFCLDQCKESHDCPS